MDNNQNNFDPVTGQGVQEVQSNNEPQVQITQQNNVEYQQPQNNNVEYQQPQNNNVQSQKKDNTLKIVLLSVGGLVLFVVILFCILFFVVFNTSKKLVCKSNEGNITIMYTDKQITGYTANGITYDLDGQKEVANQIGIDSYISQFESWFATNTSGSCEKK